LTIGAVPARQDVGLTLLLDDKLLQARHDCLAIRDRKPDLALRQSAEVFFDHHLGGVASAEFIHALDRDLPTHRRPPWSRPFLHRKSLTVVATRLIYRSPVLREELEAMYANNQAL